MSGAEFIAVLGIAASAIQVIEAGTKILERVKGYRHSLSAFQHIEHQLPLFLDDVQALSKASDLIDEAKKPALTRVLTGCSRQLEKLDKLIQSVSPAATSSRSSNIILAFKSYGKDARVREAMGILTQYQSTITLHLTTRTIVQASGPKSEPVQRRSTTILPPIRLSHFVGRTDMLHQLSGILDQSMGGRSNVAVLSGIGGQGKTQVALEFCHRTSQAGGTALWVDASSLEATVRSFEGIARELSDGKKAFGDQQSKIDYVKEELKSWHEPFVLVFDNYDEPKRFEGQQLSSFFPVAGSNVKHLILVTSRVREAERLGTCLHVDGLGEEEAIDLLLSRASVDATGQTFSGELEQASIIVKSLGHLALAIDQAAAFIRSRNLSLTKFLQHYEAKKELILEETPTIAWEYQRAHGSSSNAQALSVRTTWELSLSQIRHTNGERIKDFLTQSAFFDPSNISEVLFRTMYQDAAQTETELPAWTSLFTTSDAWDSFNFQEVVASLTNLSLVQGMTYSGDTIVFSLHPLIKEWLQIRCKLDQQLKRTFLSLLMTSLVAQSRSIDGFDFSTRQQIMGHIDHCLQNYKRYVKTNEQRREFSGITNGSITTFATFLGGHDREKEAEVLFKAVEDFYVRTLGIADTVLLRNQNNLGSLYLGLRRLKQAERVLLETYRMKCEQLGDDHHLTLNTLINIGNLRMAQGRNSEAYKTYAEFVDTYPKIGSATDMSFLKARNNLGELSMKMGDIERAESIFRALLDDIGSENPAGFALYVKANLALVARVQQKYKESVRLYKEVIEGRKLVFGPEHSTTLAAEHELSQVFRGRRIVRSTSAEGLSDRPSDLSSEIIAHHRKILYSLDLCPGKQGVRGQKTPPSHDIPRSCVPSPSNPLSRLTGKSSEPTNIELDPSSNPEHRWDDDPTLDAAYHENRWNSFGTPKINSTTSTGAAKKVSFQTGFNSSSRNEMLSNAIGSLVGSRLVNGPREYPGRPRQGLHHSHRMRRSSISRRLRNRADTDSSDDALQQTSGSHHVHRMRARSKERHFPRNEPYLTLLDVQDFLDRDATQRRGMDHVHRMRDSSPYDRRRSPSLISDSSQVDISLANDGTAANSKAPSSALRGERQSTVSRRPAPLVKNAKVNDQGSTETFSKHDLARSLNNEIPGTSPDSVPGNPLEPGGIRSNVTPRKQPISVDETSSPLSHGNRHISNDEVNNPHASPVATSNGRPFSRNSRQLDLDALRLLSRSKPSEDRNARPQYRRFGDSPASQIMAGRIGSIMDNRAEDSAIMISASRIGSSSNNAFSALEFFNERYSNRDKASATEAKRVDVGGSKDDPVD